MAMVPGRYTSDFAYQPQTLSWLQSQAMLHLRQARWMEHFQRYKYIVAYIKGDKNIVAGALTQNLDIEIGMPDNDLRLHGFAVNNSWNHCSGSKGLTLVTAHKHQN